MRAYVGVTDQDWYDFLKSQPHLDEVNFWQPSGNREFKILQPGELFLFKLHAHRNSPSYIVGGGFYGHFSRLPISIAWETFNILNGAKTFSEMLKRIAKYVHKGIPQDSHQIGCILLQQPFFLPEMSWIPVPDWNSNIVQGKSYDLSIEPGRTFWDLLNRRFTGVIPFKGIAAPGAKYGEPTFVRPRLGQGSFRILVTDAYGRRCAVTNEKTLPALDAAHIIPYSESGEHSVSNGILLRRDLHALFDQGYVTINPEMKFEVSRRIKEEFENGRDYYALHGGLVHIPTNPENQPDRQYLEWHNNNRYKG